jgi:hypothetical protein
MNLSISLNAEPARTCGYAMRRALATLRLTPGLRGNAPAP